MRLFLRVSNDSFTTILYARIFQMSFHAHSDEVGFFGDDAGDSSKMRLEGRFSVGIFYCFYDLLDAVWFDCCRVHDIRSMIGFS